MKLVDIVIVNWNTGNLLRNCLQSIFRSDLQFINSVIVVDNHSSDDSCKELPDEELLRVIECDKNHGFGKACNIGSEYAKSSYILFLNPDTIIEEKSITNAIKFMQLEKSVDIGICGIQLIYEDGVVSHSCSRFPSLFNQIVKILGLNKIFPILGAPMRDFNHLISRNVDQVMGAFFLIRREIFLANDGFDERFFVYFEEVDLSKRVSQQGYSSYFLSDAKAVHIGGGSSQNIKSKRLFYHLRSRILFFKKNHSFIEFLTLLLLTMFLEPLTRILFSLITFSFNEIIETVYAYYKLWKWFIIRA